jgi:hypothetical protein
MSNRPEKINALECLRTVRRAADAMRDSADAYLQAIESAPRPAVEVGGFYLTFDRSFVFVLKPHTRCQCPACSGRQSAAMIFGSALQGILPPGVVLPNAATSPSPEGGEAPAHEEEATAEGPPSYEVLVLRGGHGIKGVNGEEPGDRYLIDREGLVLLGNPDRGDGKDFVSNAQLGMAGLSLSRRLNVRFDPAEHPVLQ